MGQHHPLYFPHLPSDGQGYIDFFSDNSTSGEPVMMEDGMSVQFPKGWTDEDADKCERAWNWNDPAIIEPRPWIWSAY